MAITVLIELESKMTRTVPYNMVYLHLFKNRELFRFYMKYTNMFKQLFKPELRKKKAILPFPEVLIQLSLKSDCLYYMYVLVKQSACAQYQIISNELTSKLLMLGNCFVLLHLIKYR